MANEMIKSEELILKNPLGDEISLMAINNESFFEGKRYKEVFVSNASLLAGNVAQGALQIANQTMTLDKIASQTTGGIFTATVDVSKLSKFKNGTYSTMVRNEAGILEKHAGFTEVALEKTLNPAMALSVGMQVMSMVSGTYYLKRLDSQLSDIDNKLMELLQIRYDASIGKLIATRKGVTEIAQRDFVDVVDLHAIRGFKKTAEEIHEEFAYGISRKVDALLSEKKIDGKKLQEINFDMTIAFEASKLSLLAEIVEISTRLKIGGELDLVEDLINQLKKKYSNSYYYNIDQITEEIYDKYRTKIKEQLATKKKNNEKIDKLLTYIPGVNIGVFAAQITARGAIFAKDKFDESSNKKQRAAQDSTKSDLKQDINASKESEEIGSIIQEVFELPFRETEIMYIAENEKQRIFIPAND